MGIPTFFDLLWSLCNWSRSCTACGRCRYRDELCHHWRIRWSIWNPSGIRVDVPGTAHHVDFPANSHESQILCDWIWRIGILSSYLRNAARSSQLGPLGRDGHRVLIDYLLARRAPLQVGKVRRLLLIRREGVQCKYGMLRSDLKTPRSQVGHPLRAPMLQSLPGPCLRFWILVPCRRPCLA